MKKTMKYLSMAAFLVVGAVMTSCSSDDDFAGNPQQPVNVKQENIVTATTIVGLGGDDDETTRALTIDYGAKTLTKTFAPGDKVALRYKNTSNAWVKTESQALVAGDISDGGKTAKLTFTMVDPKEGGEVHYYYPASLINNSGYINPSVFFSQDGTLDGVASRDFAQYDGSMTGTTLPSSVKLENLQAIIAFTLKDGKGTVSKDDDVDITNTITGMTISDGENNYTITRAAAAGPIYLIINTTSSAIINITATDGSKKYSKKLISKTFLENNFYQQSLLMHPVGTTNGQFSISGGKKVFFSQGNLQYQASSNTWRFAENQYDYVGWTGGNNTSSGRDTQSAWIDLFGWGTSGSAPAGGTARAPYYNSTNYDDYVNTITTDGTSWGENSEWDWGHNAISNGGNTAGTWRTLTNDEWLYLFGMEGNDMEKDGHARYRKYFRATVNDVLGVVLLPDDVDESVVPGIPAESSRGKASTFAGNTYTISAWAPLEAKGCVFLPAAGQRSGSELGYVNKYCYYWSSTSRVGWGQRRAYYVDEMGPSLDSQRDYGYSVRLVRPAE